VTAAMISKTYVPGGTSATGQHGKAASAVPRRRRIGATRAWYRHAGSRPGLVRSGDRLRLCLRTTV